ncbi:beta-1,2-xylosyltransferase XYXT1-like isoform X1 [Salvia hispanica]|uniref:beta-1,2-xylosyltransferase XYXT1-like isoform X1 n=1 Tax=Salvia hispanica TaxID=49212 RepID=UPI00200969C9|nr:beta-1,2-xylosyltransferase XYXT1-like isoform X1 [Salvia hispanica]
MYDPIFAKSFSRFDRQRFGCFALVLALFIALSISSAFKPTLHPLTLIGDAVNFQLSISAVETMLIDDITVQTDSAKSMLAINETAKIEPLKLKSMLVTNESVMETMLIDDAIIDNITAQIEDSAKSMVAINETAKIEPLNLQSMLVTNESVTELAREWRNVEPLCRVLKSNADYCEIEGDVRVDANSSTIFVVKPRSYQILDTNAASDWIIEPYPRRGTGFVKKWTVKLAAEDDASVPKCDRLHSLPALLFSIGGFSGNHFHDFADLLVPLFTTSFRFKRNVHFLATDYKPWWPGKFRPLLSRLTGSEILDIDRENTTNCYGRLIAGLKFDSELVVAADSASSSGASMLKFRQLLWKTYSLNRKKAIRGDARPRLMIVSRKRTRILTNEDRISRAAEKLGFEVVSAEGDHSTNLTKFAQLVNSCDVMVGVHGAGLTNMVFLPEKAVLVQIVPLGAIDVFAKLDFGDPAAGMGIRYLDYKIGLKESSLIQKYAADHPVIRDPISIHRKGWNELRNVYLNNQNVTIDVRRFRATLAKALKLLRR